MLFAVAIAVHGCARRPSDAARGDDVGPLDATTPSLSVHVPGDTAGDYGNAEANDASSDSSTGTSDAASIAHTPVAHGLAGSFGWIEPHCGTNFIVGHVEFKPGGSTATFKFEGWQYTAEGDAITTAGTRPGTLRLTVVRTELAMPPLMPGAGLFDFRGRKDGALDVFSPPGNCLPKSGVFWPRGVGPKLTPKTKVFRCASGEIPTAGRSGCACPGSATIHNPCSVGGMNPEVVGDTCVFSCAD